MVPFGPGEAAMGMGGGEAAPPVASARCSRSHSEAERKRRQRINAHLATLRTLLPSAARMDKAALLGEVVRHVRELRGRANDAAAGVAVPDEGDEVGVEEEETAAEDREEMRRLRAWVCCADRPGLMQELSRAVGSVRARAVRAEIATVGGRTTSVLEVEMAAVAAAGEGGGKGRSAALQAALRAVLLNRDGRVLSDQCKRPCLTNQFGSTQ